MKTKNLAEWSYKVSNRMWLNKGIITRGCLDRPRLQINNEKLSKLTIYKAPLGFGKSVQVAFAARYSESASGKTAYINSLALSGTELLSQTHLAALILSQISENENWFQKSTAEHLVALLKTKLNSELGPISICIDDVGLFSSCNRFVEELLNETPDNIRFVVSDGAFGGSSYLSLYSGVKIFDHNDMAFTELEVKELMSASQFNHEKNIDASIISNSTGGWPAILSFALRNTYSDTPPETWPETVSYFEEKLLNNLSETTMDFFCKFSILHEVSTESFNYVFKVKDSASEIQRALHDYRILQNTEKPNNYKFINPVVKHYFKRKFEIKYSQQRSYFLKRIAFFHWHRGEYENAINTAINASDYRWAPVISQNIIFDVAFRLGAIEQLLKWFKTIPKGTIKRMSSLSMSYAWVLYFSQNARCAEEILTSSKLNYCRSLTDIEEGGWRCLVEAIGKATNDKISDSFTLCSKWIDKYGANNTVGKSAVFTCLAYLSVSDRRFSELKTLTSKAKSAIYASEQHYANLWLSITLIQAELFKGNIVHAMSAFKKANLESTHNANTNFSRDTLSILELQILLELDHKKVSQDSFLKFVDFAISYGVSDILWGFANSAADLLFDRGFPEKASSIMERVRITSSERGLTRLEALANLKLLEYQILAGDISFDLDNAIECVELECSKNQNNVISAHKNILKSLDRLRVGKHLSIAAHQANRALKYAESILDSRLGITAQYCQAAALFLSGSKAQAERIIAQTNVSVEHLSCHFTSYSIKKRLVIIHPGLDSLFSKLPDNEHTRINNLQLTHNVINSRENLENCEVKLSAKQRSLINCISTGMSNREIAEYLSISEETVKWHLKKIYNELNVNKRVHAINEAKRLGLL